MKGYYLKSLINVVKIAITGTPGTGKHTLAKETGKRLGLEVVDLGKIAKEKKLGYKDAKRKVWVADIKKLRKETRKLKNCILVSSYAELMPNDLVLVVRCHPRTLAKRLKKRGYSREKMLENLECECLDSCLISALQHNNRKKVYEVDNTKGLKKTVKEALRIIKDRPEPKVGRYNYSEYADRLEKLV